MERSTFDFPLDFATFVRTQGPNCATHRIGKTHFRQI